VLCRSCHSREHRLAELGARRASSAVQLATSNSTSRSTVVSRAGQGSKGVQEPRRYSLPWTAKKSAPARRGEPSRNSGGGDG
jgi:hypothetical protein